MIKNKVVLIFAATGEIASEIAKHFARMGAKVYLSGRNLENLEKIKLEIIKNNGFAKISKVDATNESEIHSYVNSIIEIENKIDIIFNGIGISPSEGMYGAPITELQFDNFLLPISTHAGSQFLTAKAVAPQMIRQKSGVILTLSASIGKEARPFMAGVSTACAAIEGLTRVLAAELGQFGIRVLCLRAGAIFETRTIKETITANSKTAGVDAESFRKLILQSALLRRSPSLFEIAKAAEFFVSDSASAMTGQVINVSAGLVLH